MPDSPGLPPRKRWTTKITCVGILVADVLVTADGPPPARGQLTLADEIRLHAGGSAANTAMTLARLGARVKVAGRVGADPLGRFLVEELERVGVGAGGVFADPDRPTSTSVVLVDPDGERRFLHSLGANAGLCAADLSPTVAVDGQALHVAGALLLPALDGPPLADLMAAARQRGLLTSVDVAWDATGRWDRLHPVLPHLDLFVPNLVEAQAIAGVQAPEEIARWLRSRGVERVAITLGTDGCYGASKDFEGIVPAPRVKPCDTTGAGDAFAAGLLAGLLDGLPFDSALRLGNAVGAFTTTTFGPTAPGLSKETLMANMTDQCAH